jgi:pimeloyl-ACP methyl ester carboxylesterase
MGAAAAALMAVCHPGLVSCLILEDPSWWLADETDERRAQLAAFRDMLMERRKVQSPADLAAFGRQMTPSWAEEEFGPWAESKFQFHPNVFDQVRYQTGDWREIVPRIKVPTLLITADVKLGAIITTGIAEQVRRLNSNIQSVHIPEAGHNIRRDQFERYIQAIQRFLDKNYSAHRLIL